MGAFDNGNMRPETQRQLLYAACYESGLDGHITTLYRKGDARTPAEKIAVLNTGRRDFPLPVKCSYMYCDGLDMTFWYDRFGGAHMAFSGITELYSADIREGNLKKAFEIAEKMLRNMENAVESYGDF